MATIQPAAETLRPDDLRVVDTLEDLPAEDLQWLLDHGDFVGLEPGERYINFGDPAEYMFIVLEGRTKFDRKIGSDYVTVATTEQPMMTGLLPFSRAVNWIGDGQAVTACRMVRIHKDQFRNMIYAIPELAPRLVALLSDRVRSGTQRAEAREKMFALGKLASGMAHELNNPAAAIKRAAADLQHALATSRELVTRLSRHALDDAQRSALQDLIAEWTARPIPSLSTLERGEREDELADWLDEVPGVSDAWDVAGTLIEFDITPDDLEQLRAAAPTEALGDLIAWVAGSFSSTRLTGDIQSAADRISQLVASVKSYSHMDQAPDRSAADLREGIENTLTMLGHKIRNASIQVVRDWPEDLPAVPVFVGELNQVWTNLIDNAIDAMASQTEGDRRLTIRASADANEVEVRIGDTGPGIPDEIQRRIFEAFFTTKGVGKGTGLGLDIANRIVTQRHSGRLDVTSRPGATEFVVTLPRSVAR